MSIPPQVDPANAAYERGRAMGLATGALSLSVVAYVNLLSLEKSILAIVLAWLALRAAARVGGALGRGRLALLIAGVHVVTVVTVVVVFHDKLLHLLHLFQQLS
jgi:hypothetical protein